MSIADLAKKWGTSPEEAGKKVLAEVPSAMGVAE
jgi:hypothetical protein